MEYTLEYIATYIKGNLTGDGAIRVSGVNSLDAVKEGEIVFAEDGRHVALALHSKAAAVIVGPGEVDLQGKPVIGVKNPKLAFAMLLALFNPVPPVKGIIHPSAVIGKEVSIGEGVDILANAVVGDRVRIGRGTSVLPCTYIGDDVEIGQNCLIGPNAVIYRKAVIGSRVAIHGGSVIGGDGFGYVFHEGAHVKVPQVGNVVIEDDVEIGCNVCVDRATLGSTLIRRGTKVDNLVQIAHNNRIGRNVIIAGQVGLSGSVSVGDYAMFAGRSGAVDHVNIGDRVRVGAGSIVTKSVAAGEDVLGFPARAAKGTKAQMAAFTHLPDMIKNLGSLLKRMTSAEERLDKSEREHESEKSLK